MLKSPGRNRMNQLTGGNRSSATSVPSALINTSPSPTSRKASRTSFSVISRRRWPTSTIPCSTLEVTRPLTTSSWVSSSVSFLVKYSSTGVCAISTFSRSDRVSRISSSPQRKRSRRITMSSTMPSEKGQR